MTPEEGSTEPTMEEILASIRKIISEDDPAGDEAGNGTGDGGEADGDDILELAELDGEDDLPDRDGEPVLSPEEDDGIIAGDGKSLAEEAVTLPPPPPVPPPPPQVPPPDLPPPRSAPGGERETAARDDDALISEMASREVSNGFAEFASQVGMRKGVHLGANATLEEIVKELLRPMLREWLDEHLPAVVYRIVEREIVKLSGQVDR